MRDDFDRAAKGSSALDATMERQWCFEAARYVGDEGAAILWDLERFFDTVDFEVLLSQAMAWSYPRRLMVLALLQHMAPRTLTYKGVCSQCVAVLRGVLPGCMHAVPFVKALLKEQLGQVQRAAEQVRQTSYVDDFAQLALGHMVDVVDSLVAAGTRYVHGMSLLKLTLSTKSVMVATSPRLESLLRKTLASAGVDLKVARAPRDLGHGLVARSGRRVPLQRQRRGKAAPRLRAIQRICGITPVARKLVRTGYMPQCLWGHAAMGLAPTVLRTIRWKIAQVFAPRLKGRCLATVLALALGPYEDPQITLTMQMVGAWLSMWRRCRDLHARGRVAWRAAVARVRASVAAGNSPWLWIGGPMSAMVATLEEQGWQLDFPEVWRDPGGQQWAIDDETPIAQVTIMVRTYAAQYVWKQACAEGHLPGGLGDGVNWRVSLRWLGKLRSQGRSREAAVLEMFLAGGCWTEARKHEQLHVQPGSCDLCQQPAPSIQHVVWQCPSTVEARWGAAAS